MTWFPCSIIQLLKGTIHPQIILLKYVKLITVNKKLTIIMMNKHRYKEIIPITGGPPLRLHRMPDLKTEREKSSALTSHGPGVQRVHIDTS